MGEKPGKGTFVEGRNDYLYVTFPNNPIPIPVQLRRTSDIAYATLTKIDLPQNMHPVELSSSDPVNPDDPITVAGYPGVFPNNEMTSLFKWLRGGGQGMDDYEIDVALASDPGCCRPNNEDCVQFFSTQDDPQSALAIVADGMGGHNAGEIASREAVATIGSRYLRRLSWNPLQALSAGFSDANTHVFALAGQHPEWSGMGTTATALLIVKGMASYAHVGDSRLYRLRGTTMEQLSSDHTLVAALARDGLIPPEVAGNHPDRNIITRAIGTKSSVEVEVCKTEWSIQIGDVYLLCSDGLYDLVTDQDIESILRENQLPEACEALVTAAKDKGGYDNISVIVLAIRKKQLVSAEPPPTKI